MKLFTKKTKLMLMGLALSSNLLNAQSLFDIVEGSPDHTILETALIQEGLNTVLSDAGTYTLFAPTDDAFNEFFTNTGLNATTLLANPELTQILLHHVLNFEAASGSLTNSEVTTMNGKDVTINIDAGVKIDSAIVESPDVPADNGILHVVDYVLLPTYDNVAEVVALSPDHTTLLAALERAGLVGALADLSKEYTVFAPTNDAFDAFLLDAGLTATELLDNPDLGDILLHHVLNIEALSGSLSNAEVTTLNGKDVTVNIDAGVKIDSANVTAPDIVTDNGVVHVIDYVLVPTYDNVAEVVALSPDHTTLLAALERAGLVSALADLSKEYTVFAPTNDAFDAFLLDAGITATELLDNPDLGDILLHHVLNIEALSGSLSNAEVTTLNGKDVSVNIDAGVKIDSANVTAPDIVTDNGVVHVIDYVLLPTYDNVAEVVALSPDHTTLLAALERAGLVSALADLSKEYTVFAPTNDAFDAFLLDAGLTATELLDNPDLGDILLHHVLNVEALSGSLSNAEVTTLNGKDVTVNIDAGVKIDSANVTAPDIVTDNGVVHVIDYVLVPTYDNVAEVVALSPDHTTLLAALERAGLVSALADLSKEYTVFAPTNDAFDAFLLDAGLTATELLDNPDLGDILLHHVLNVEALSGSLSNAEVTTLNGKDVTVNIDAGVKIDSANVTAPDIVTDNGVVHVIDYVLVPTYDNVAEVVALSPDHTTLLAALERAGLVSALADLSKEYTVFAPTNEAFDAFLLDASLTATELLDNPDLGDILLHHVLGEKFLSTDLSNGDVTTLNSTDITISLGDDVKINTATVTGPDVDTDNGVVHVIDQVLEINGSENVYSINEVELSIYPNPTTSSISIANIEDNTIVEIFNSNGKLIKSINYSPNQLIDVSDLSTGVYYLKSQSLLQVNSFVKK